MTGRPTLDDPVTETVLARTVVHLGQGTGVLQRTDAARAIRAKIDETDSDAVVAVIDLDATEPTTRVLREIFVPLWEASRERSITCVIASRDAATRDVIAWLADANDIGVYLSSCVECLEDAKPAGDLSAADKETLEQLNRAGGTVTAPQLAAWTNLEPTAVSNRLVNLARKGYVLRIQRPRRKGDYFIDPRTVTPPEAVSAPATTN